MRVIKIQYLRVTLDVVKALLDGWEKNWEGAYPPSKIRISCVAAAGVIIFCVGLSREEIFLSSLKGVLDFWEDKKLQKGQAHVMVTL